MSDISLEYLAGFFDGEGCIVIDKDRRKKSPNYQLVARIKLAAHQSSVLYEFLKRFGGNIYNHKAYVTFYYSAKAQKSWRVNGQFAYSFLLTISPFLVLKKPQAELAMEFYTSKFNRSGTAVLPEETEKRENFYRKLQEMKVS